jgi:hypothetical protein
LIESCNYAKIGNEPIHPSARAIAMTDPTAPGTIDQAAFEALRARWEQAQANGTVDAFVQEIIKDTVAIPPPPLEVYESPEERAAYEQARAMPCDLGEMVRGILPLYFGDEPGIPMEQLLQELEILSRSDSEPGTGTTHDSAG